MLSINQQLKNYGVYFASLSRTLQGTFKGRIFIEEVNFSTFKSSSSSKAPASKQHYAACLAQYVLCSLFALDLAYDIMRKLYFRRSDLPPALKAKLQYTRWWILDALILMPMALTCLEGLIADNWLDRVSHQMQPYYNVYDTINGNQPHQLLLARDTSAIQV